MPATPFPIRIRRRAYGTTPSALATRTAANGDDRHSHTLQSTPESGHRAGYGGYQRRKGANIHAAVDSLGQ